MIATAAGKFETRLRELLPRRLGERIDQLVEMPPGGNNTLWKAVTVRGGSYLVKRYTSRSGDGLGRLGREMSALGFLWRQGVRSIPEPLFAATEERVGVFAFVEGAPIRAGEVSGADAAAAAEFLVLLQRLAARPEATALSPASEAVLAPSGYRDVVERRRAALLAAARHVEPGLERFLRDELPGLFGVAERFARAEADRRGVSWAGDLERFRQTLSPSDFGFHNALRRADGSLVFVDFEYFGWDDPAKALADALHQPAVPLPQVLRAPFLAGALRGFPGKERVADRLAVVYPLTGVNWCLIMLNPFLRGETRDVVALDRRRDRLAAAREKADRLREELTRRSFPLGGEP